MAINLRLSPQEDQLLERYCGLTRRTKTDVIRELVRGLKIVEDPLGVVQLPQTDAERELEQRTLELAQQSSLLPPGWKYDPDFKCFEGEYGDEFISIQREGNDFAIHISGDDHAVHHGANVLEAIAFAQMIIDNPEDEDEEYDED